MGMTSLHWAARSKQASVFEFIQTLLLQEEWVELLAMKDEGGESVMHTAANSRCDVVLEKILGTVTNAGWEMLLKIQDAGGKNPDVLLCAACKDNLFLLKATMNSQVNIASVSSYSMFCRLLYDGKSLLHTACCKGSVGVVEYILECLPPEKCIKALKQQHRSGHTALHFAIESGGHELVELFSKLVPEENFMQLLQCNGKVGTPLHAVAMSNNVVIAKCLLDSIPVDKRIQLLSKHDHNKQSPLHSAIRYANSNMFKCTQLLNVADIASDNVMLPILKALIVDWRSPLPNSSRKVSLEVIQCIMNIIPADERISYLMNVDGGGRSSFQLAARYANVDIMKFLLSFLDADQCITALKTHDQHGKSVPSAEKRVNILQQRDERGSSSFHVAAQYANPDVVEFLLGLIPADKRITEFESKDGDGQLLLHHACRNQDTKVAKIVLDNIPKEERIRLLLIEDKNNVAAIHIAFFNVDAMKQILETTVSAHRLLNLLEKQSWLKSFRYGFHFDTMVLLKVLKLFPNDLQFTLSKLCDDDGMTILHSLCDLCNESEEEYITKSIDSVLQALPSEQRIQLLLIQNKWGRTVVHYLAGKENRHPLEFGDVIKLIQKLVPGDQHIQLLLVQDESGMTVLHYLCELYEEDEAYTRLYNVDCILLALPYEQRIQLLLMKDKKDRTFLHCLYSNNLIYPQVSQLDEIEPTPKFVQLDLCIKLLLAELLLMQDKTGQDRTIVHYLAGNVNVSPHDFEDVMMLILKLVPVDNRIRLLLVQDESGMTILHDLCSHRYFDLTIVENCKHIEDVIGYILSSLTVEHRIQLLLIQDSRGMTVLHCLTSCKEIYPKVLKDMMKAIQQLVSADKWIQLLLAQDESGLTILHSLCEPDDDGEIKEDFIIEYIDYILQPLSSEQRIQVLLMKDDSDRTCMHYLSGNKVISLQVFLDVMKLIEELVPVDQRIELLLAQDESGMTILHCLCESDDDGELQQDCIMDNIDYILQPLSSEQRIELLLMQDKRDRTFLHCLTSKKDISLQEVQDVIMLIQELVPADQGIHLLHTKNASGMTILHCLCSSGRFIWLEKEYIKDIIGYILRRLPSEQCIQILLTQDKTDRTFLHCLSSDKSPQVFKNVMELILELVPADKLIQLLLVQDECGMTFLHCLCAPSFYSQLEEEFIKKSILQTLQTEHRIQLLLKQDKKGRTALHYLFTHPTFHIIQSYIMALQRVIRAILEHVPADRRLDIVEKQDEDGETVLHYALITWKTIHIFINTTQFVQLLVIQDNHGRTALQCPAKRGCSQEGVIGCLQIVPANQRYQLLAMQDKEGKTALHHWSEHHQNGQTLKQMVELVPSKQQVPLIFVLDKMGKTALHLTCVPAFQTPYHTHNVMLQLLDIINHPRHCLLFIPLLCVLASTRYTVQHKTDVKPKNLCLNVSYSDEPRELSFDFLQSVPVGPHCTLQVRQTNSYGQTTFRFVLYDNANVDNQMGSDNVTSQIRGHLPAALVGYASLLKLLLESISNQQQKLVLRSNRFADNSETEPWNTSESFDMLEKFLTESRVSEALETTDSEERRRLLIGIIDDAPLDALQIHRLSSPSEYFILPSNRRLAKCYGIILYNKEGREGATMEAIQLEEALTALGCAVRKLDWTNASRLNELVNTEIHKIRDSCFLLFVCIMSHGKPGMLEGSNGSRVPVNDVLFQFESHLHHNVPLVMMIQSCQLYGTEGNPSTSRQGTLDARMTSAPADNKHIVLRRPNTALLLSTVSGGGAYRGVFTGAMAEQLCKADGKTDLHTMFNKALHSMRQKQPEDEKQQPLFQSTMTKSLFLQSQLSVAKKRPGEADKTAAKHFKTS